MLIVWCLMPFSTVFQLYCGGMCTYPCFPRVLLTSTPHNTLSKPLAAFPHRHLQTAESSERGMNLVAMTIINPQKEYWPSQESNQRPPFRKSATLPTELWGLASYKCSQRYTSKHLLCYFARPSFVSIQRYLILFYSHL